MKQVHPSYSFNASTKTITLTGLNIDQDQLLLVVNATRGVQYFNFADSSLRATVTPGANTSVVLTDASTNGHANGDALVIYYDDQVSSQVVSGTVTANPGTNPFTVTGSVALDNASLVALENITVTVGSSVALAAGSAQVGSVTVSNFPATQTIAGTVTANVPLYEYDIQYIRCSFNITRTDSANIYGDVYLRKINDYRYESIRYQGGEDEAYLNIYLWEGDGENQKVWRFEVSGAFADITGNLAYKYPQDAGEFGSVLPPKTGWSLIENLSGSILITYEQPHLNNIQGTVTVGNSVTIGSLPAISGTVTANLSSVPTHGVTIANSSVTVNGTFYQATQPVSLASLPSLAAGTAQIGSVTASISGTVPVSISSVTIGANPSGALTTRFGSVTTANTSQLTSCVTNSSRKYLLAQNISAGTVTIGIGFSPTTTQGIQLTAGAGLTFDAFCPTGAVYWLGAVTGAAWTILEG